MLYAYLTRARPRARQLFIYIGRRRARLRVIPIAAARRFSCATSQVDSMVRFLVLFSGGASSLARIYKIPVCGAPGGIATAGQEALLPAVTRFAAVVANE